MKYIDILLLVLCLNIAIFIMTQTGIFAVFGSKHIMHADMDKMVLQYNQTASTAQLNWQNPGVLDYMMALGVTLWQSINLVFKIFSSIIFLAPMLIELGIPSELALLFSAPVYFVYLWGLFQILSGRPGRTME